MTAGHSRCTAQVEVGDTCCDNRGPKFTPFRTLVWRVDPDTLTGYWLDLQMPRRFRRHAEEQARSLAAATRTAGRRATFHGTVLAHVPVTPVS